MANHKSQADSLIHARWVIPMEGDSTLLENQCIAIVNGKITAIGDNDDITSHYASDTHYELSDHVVIPGLINLHGHAAMSLFRGLADDLPLMTWLEEHIWPAEGQWVSEDFVRDGSRLAIAEMLLGGVTTFSDMYFFPEQVAAQAEAFGLKTQVCTPIMDFPTPYGSGPDDYIDKALTLNERFKNNANISVAFGPHAPYSVSDSVFEKISALSDQHQMRIHVHLHETAFEVQESIKNTGMRPIQRLDQLGAIHQGTQCVHMTALNDADIQLVSDRKAAVIHCPESNLKLASGFAPVQKLLKKGILVGLGTDGAASNNDLDLLAEARTAALLAKAVAEDASALPAYETLKMLTINAAKILGIEATTGSLAVGKSADLIAIDFSQLNTLPLYNPISQLVYATNKQQISHVWSQGRLKVKHHQLTEIDTQALRETSQRWQHKISTK